MEIKNALIEDVIITNDDHGWLTIWVFLDYGGSGQGFGGYCLYNPKSEADLTGKFLWRVMEVAGVTKVSDLKGKPVRAKTALGETIKAIGHFTKDIWFNPSEELTII